MLAIQGYSTGNGLEIEANTNALRVNERGINVGAYGSYSASAVNGTTVMAAGLAAAAPIFALRSAAAAGPLVVIRRVRFEANVGTTAFANTPGYFQLFVARAFSASDTGGAAATLTTNNAKRRTAFGTTALQDFRYSQAATLTAGTRTLDSTPIASVVTQNVATAGAQLVPPTDLLRYGPDAWPLILAANEGIVIQATVPATGVWNFSVSVDWDEVAATGTI
jgi:hypothetical protein